MNTTMNYNNICPVCGNDNSDGESCNCKYCEDNNDQD